eukprot:g5079.t1
MSLSYAKLERSLMLLTPARSHTTTTFCLQNRIQSRKIVQGRFIHRCSTAIDRSFGTESATSVRSSVTWKLSFASKNPCASHSRGLITSTRVHSKLSNKPEPPGISGQIKDYSAVGNVNSCSSFTNVSRDLPAEKSRDANTDRGEMQGGFETSCPARTKIESPIAAKVESPIATSSETKCPKRIIPSEKDLNCFSIFGMEEQFEIDLEWLKGQFRNLQRQYHPDLVRQLPEEDQKRAELHSAQVNQAYQTLRDPLTRARYILQLHGESLKEKGSLQDPVLLMEVMEAREALEDAKGDPNALMKLLKENEDLEGQAYDRVAKAYKAGDWAGVKQHTIRLSYYAKLAREIRTCLPARE